MPENADIHSLKCFCDNEKLRLQVILLPEPINVKNIPIFFEETSKSEQKGESQQQSSGEQQKSESGEQKVESKQSSESSEPLKEHGI